MMVDSEGILRLFLDIRVTAEELKTWEPARIVAFFKGIAMVEAAIHDQQPAPTDALRKAT